MSLNAPCWKSDRYFQSITAMSNPECGVRVSRIHCTDDHGWIILSMRNKSLPLCWLNLTKLQLHVALTQLAFIHCVLYIDKVIFIVLLLFQISWCLSADTECRYRGQRTAGGWECRQRRRPAPGRGGHRPRYTLENNKTEYFRLRLSYKVSKECWVRESLKRPETEYRQTLER